MCKREFLNYLRVREWQDFESQLRQVCKEMKIEIGKPADGTGDEDAIHQALLSGLLSHIGALEEREKEPARGARKPMREYLGARGAKFAIFPGSGLKGKNPQFLMAGELVETGRLWARQNAAIKPEWAERLAGDLAKRTYSEPHWSKKRAQVLAYEKVTLYGVPIVTERLISFGKIAPELSRELFIRHALVQGEWHTQQKFMRDNLRLLEEAEELEHRARRRDIVVDEHTLFDFYDARVGREVVSGAHFDQWWKVERRKRPDLLTFDLSMLTHESAEEISEADYPEEWSVGDQIGLSFPISYHFEPGAPDDGITIDVPVTTLNRVAADDFSWNVPGLREELVTSLIRSLPKQLRVSFVPAPNQAREFLAAVPPGEEPLLDALERWAAVDDRRGRAARRLGLDEGARAPAADLPGGRRGRRGAGARQGPRGAEGAAAAAVRAGDGRGRGRHRSLAHRRDVVGVRHDRGVVPRGARRPRGAGLPGAGRRGRRRSG